MELQKIASFQMDHTKLLQGIYTSRMDGDITTYDIRMVRPNLGGYLENGVLHTIEHLFATFVRSGRFQAHIIYFGPMGCRTGFYLLVRNLPSRDVIALIQEGFDFMAAYEGEIPGATVEECGNYREQDLEGAKNATTKMLPILQSWTPEKLSYLP